MYRFRGWADLPEGLLYSIIDQLGLASSHDLLAFAATCRSWHAAVSTLLPIFPPLLLQPDVPLCSPRPRPHTFSNNLVSTRPCHVTVITNKDVDLCCEIPLFGLFGGKNTLPIPLERSFQETENLLGMFCFRGASYGHLILSSNKSCIVFDVFTGASVSPPQLPVFRDTELYYGALTAPLASPNSHLVVDTGSHNLFWRVGSQSWVRRSPEDGPIKHIVVSKGQVFGMDFERRLFKVHLTDKIHIEEMPVCEASMISRWKLPNVWLVACGDMLLLVGCRGSIVTTGETFEAFRLHQSAESAEWVKLEKLENSAIFISTDKRSQALSCMSPEVWGGRSNCIYCYNHDSKHWIAFELGKPVQVGGSKFNPSDWVSICCGNMMLPMWVVPSTLSLRR